MKKTKVVIDLSIEDYIKSYIEKTEFNKTKIYSISQVIQIFKSFKSTGAVNKYLSNSKSLYSLSFKLIDKFSHEVIQIK
jgi:hypothetical protein